MLLCDDLATTLQQLVRRHPALAGRRIHTHEELLEAIRVSPAVKHLVAYVLSESYLEARESLDMAHTDFDLAAELPAEPAPTSLDEKAVAEFELEIERGSVEEPD